MWAKRQSTAKHDGDGDESIRIVSALHETTSSSSIDVKTMNQGDPFSLSGSNHLNGSNHLSGSNHNSVTRRRKSDNFDESYGEFGDFSGAPSDDPNPANDKLEDSFGEFGEFSFGEPSHDLNPANNKLKALNQSEDNPEAYRSESRRKFLASGFSWNKAKLVRMLSGRSLLFGDSSAEPLDDPAPISDKLEPPKQSEENSEAYSSGSRRKLLASGFSLNKAKMGRMLSSRSILAGDFSGEPSDDPAPTSDKLEPLKNQPEDNSEVYSSRSRRKLLASGFSWKKAKIARMMSSRSILSGAENEEEEQNDWGAFKEEGDAMSAIHSVGTYYTQHTHISNDTARLYAPGDDESLATTDLADKYTSTKQKLALRTTTLRQSRDHGHRSKHNSLDLPEEDEKKGKSRRWPSSSDNEFSKLGEDSKRGRLRKDGSRRRDKKKEAKEDASFIF
jgi:hypothetical protein